MKARWLLALSLLGGCAVEVDTSDITQHVAGQTILLPASGTGQRRVVMDAFNPLAVTLYDLDGAPISGATITFTAPSAGASSSFPFDAKAETDGDGRAELRPCANQVAGTYLVYAHADGADAMPFVLTNLAGAPAAAQPLLGDHQYSGFGQPFAQPLALEVRDAYGNPVPSAPVDFVAPVDGPTASMLGGATVTDAAGRASAFAVASAQAGTYTVQAKVGTTAAQFTLSNTDPRDTSWRIKAAIMASIHQFEPAP